MEYAQLIGTTNSVFRDAWVAAILRRVREPDRVQALLDVGAGLSPYRAAALELGFKDRSQDFGQYSPAASAGGLQNHIWEYANHDFLCDIVEIPDEACSDVVLCTEVLEHVPDPVAAFRRMTQLVAADGLLIVTVPFVSLMHQAPYWFQAGLSPQWFEYWAKESGLGIAELVVQGDHIDFMQQEVGRLLTFKHPIKGLNRVGRALVRPMRRLLPQHVLDSGVLGTLFIGVRSGKPE